MSSLSLLPALPRESSLVLLSLSEPSTNDLRIILIESLPSAEFVETELGPAQTVAPNLTSRAFELIWWRYVAYSVRNESFYKPEENQLPSPAFTGTRQASAFLAYVAATTFATDDYPGALTHWYVHTEWHCIDVVSDAAPDVRELGKDEIAALLDGDGGQGHRIFRMPGDPVH